MIPRIVITGAPSSGKTEFSARLKSHSAFSGFLFFDELARQLLAENSHYRNNWSKFHIELYHRQATRENQVHDRPFITDRGTADAFAFHSAAMSEVGTTLEKEHQRYSAVVQLGTSAIMGERFYRRDRIRNEPVEKALAIEEEIKKVWCGHPGYYFVEAEIDFEKKFRTFLKLVLKLIRIDG